MKDVTQLPSITGWMARHAWWIVFATVVLVIFANAWTQIKPGRVGVLPTTLGSSKVLEPGLHMRLPFTPAPRVFEIGEAAAFLRLTAHLADGQPVEFAINWQYSITPDVAARLAEPYKDRAAFVTQFFSPLMEEAASQVLIGMDAQMLIASRPELSGTIRDRFRELLEGQLGAADKPISIPVGFLTVSDLKFSPAYYSTLDRRLESEATISTLKLEAEAINAIPNGVQIVSARRWNGQLPLVVLGTGMTAPWSELFQKSQDQE